MYENRSVEDCAITDVIKDIPQLSDEEANSLEGEISLTEATEALKNMKNLKRVLVLMDLLLNFLKMFWGKIGTFVFRSLNSSFTY